MELLRGDNVPNEYLDAARVKRIGLTNGLKEDDGGNLSIGLGSGLRYDTGADALFASSEVAKLVRSLDAYYICDTLQDAGETLPDALKLSDGRVSSNTENIDSSGAGIQGNGLKFAVATDGDHVDLNGPTLNPGGDDFTWALWVNLVETTAAQDILVAENADATKHVRLRYQGTGAGNGLEAEHNGQTLSTADFVAGAFQFIVLRRTGDSLDLFVADTNVTAPSANGASGSIASLTSTATQLGHVSAIGSPTSNGLEGVIDEVGVWRRSLSTSEIDALHNAGNGTREFLDVLRLQLPSVLTVAASDAPAYAAQSAHFVCTGVDDDKVIQRALDLANAAAGPQIVKLTGGSFEVYNDITMHAQQTLRGAGKDSTVLTSHSANSNVFTIVINVEGASVADMTVDNNKANRTDTVFSERCVEIDASASNTLVSNVICRNSKRDGLRNTSTSANHVVSHCEFAQNEEYGLSVTGSAAYVYVTGCTGTGNGFFGISLIGMQAAFMSDCHATGSGFRVSMDASLARVTMVNCIGTSDAGQALFLLKCDGFLSISNCQFQQTSVANETPIIEFNDASSTGSLTMVGCTVKSVDGTGRGPAMDIAGLPLLSIQGCLFESVSDSNNHTIVIRDTFSDQHNIIANSVVSDIIDAKMDSGRLTVSGCVMGRAIQDAHGIVTQTGNDIVTSVQA